MRGLRKVPKIAGKQVLSNKRRAKPRIHAGNPRPGEHQDSRRSRFPVQSERFAARSTHAQTDKQQEQTPQQERNGSFCQYRKGKEREAQILQPESALMCRDQQHSNSAEQKRREHHVEETDVAKSEGGGDGG